MLYTTSRELFLQVLQPVGIKAKLASLNILWLGGASSAANAVFLSSMVGENLNHPKMAMWREIYRKY